MTYYPFLTGYVQSIAGNLFIRLLMLSICADMVFGSLRAVKYRCWNSAVGIDGGIRKVGMAAGVLILGITDRLLPLNLIGWVKGDSMELLQAAGIRQLGVTELFAALFILYELTSVLKNMLLCGLPIPAGIRRALNKWLDEMTDETAAE